jgi:hypothetical protein
VMFPCRLNERDSFLNSKNCLNVNLCVRVWHREQIICSPVFFM